MPGKSSETINSLMNLSEDQIQKLFDLSKKLWIEGHLVIEIVKNFDWFSATFKNAVDKLNGKIHLDSVVNEGTSFTITIPL